MGQAHLNDCSGRGFPAARLIGTIGFTVIYPMNPQQTFTSFEFTLSTQQASNHYMELSKKFRAPYRLTRYHGPHPPASTFDVGLRVSSTSTFVFSPTPTRVRRRFVQKTFKILSHSSKRKYQEADRGSSAGGGGHVDIAASLHNGDRERGEASGGGSMHGGTPESGFHESSRGEYRGHVSSAEETAIAQVCISGCCRLFSLFLIFAICMPTL